MSGKFTKARALLVGVADYAHVPPLPDMVRRDAIDIAAALSASEVSGYNPTAVKLLINERATAAAIRDELAQAALAMSEGETFLFYFSGHGARVKVGATEQSCLVPYEANLNDLAGTVLLDSELLFLLNTIPAKRQVVMLDACHSGGVGTLKGMVTAPARGFDGLANGSGRVLFCSSRPDEVSLALSTMENSVFTAVLLDALEGAASDRGDGYIGVFDLFSYISSEVPKLASQRPIFNAEGLEDNFAVARCPISKNTTRTPKAIPLSATQQIEALLCALYPLGPMNDQIWQRAGGDASRLDISGKGIAQWHAAIRTLTLGGGGLTFESLLKAVAKDYPCNETLAELRQHQ
jgi:metacaspase-1